MKKFLFYKQKIHRFIHEHLKKYPKVNYLQRVWRYRNDEKFVSKVMRIGYEPNVIELKSFGEKNPGKNIYFVNIVGRNYIGFGVYLRQTLYGLYEAEYLGFVPVVYYQPQGCLYAEDEEVNGTSNPFEYYFEQVSDVSVEDVYESARVFLYEAAHSTRIEARLGNMNPNMPGGYLVNNDIYMSEMGRVFKKYMRLNQVVGNQVSTDMQQLSPDGWEGEKTLGVHIRGTDYALNWVNHPNMVTADEFIQAIDEVMETYAYKYIFLATDDKRRLESLRAKYGSKLIYYKDVARGENELNIAMEQNDRPMHHYLNGFEVLRDMYTLANCDSLVCGLSQISIAVRIIRLAGDSPYTYLKVLDKGLYQG